MELLRAMNGVQSCGATDEQVLKEYYVTEERNEME
jgi:hypothetical protein